MRSILQAPSIFSQSCSNSDEKAQKSLNLLPMIPSLVISHNNLITNYHLTAEPCIYSISRVTGHRKGGQRRSKWHFSIAFPRELTRGLTSCNYFWMTAMISAVLTWKKWIVFGDTILGHILDFWDHNCTPVPKNDPQYTGPEKWFAKHS